MIENHCYKEHSAVKKAQTQRWVPTPRRSHTKNDNTKEGAKRNKGGGDEKAWENTNEHKAMMRMYSKECQ